MAFFFLFTEHTGNCAKLSLAIENNLLLQDNYCSVLLKQIKLARFSAQKGLSLWLIWMQLPISGFNLLLK